MHVFANTTENSSRSWTDNGKVLKPSKESLYNFACRRVNAFSFFMDFGMAKNRLDITMLMSTCWSVFIRT